MPMLTPSRAAAPSPWALGFRLVSLLIVFSQAAIPLYSISNPFIGLFIMACAALAAYAIARLDLKAVVEAGFCVLFPLAMRAFVFLCLSAYAGLRPSPEADALFLSFDQSFLPAFLPAVWMGLSSMLAWRSLAFTRMEPIANAALFVLAFASESGFKLQKYPHPSLLAIAAGSFILSEAARLAFAERTSGKASRRKAYALPLVLLPLLVFLFLFLLGRYSEKATQAGGGLIKPTLSRFDFSRYLKLESEISLSKDLILLVKKDSQDPNIFLRRHILSGYDVKKGFFAEESPWVEDLPATLPGRQTTFKRTEGKGRVALEQEYYIVNFDPGSFIAMNDPLSVTPLGNWNSSSFKSIYRVTSAVPGLALFLGDFPSEGGPAAEGEPSEGSESKARAYYTEYGHDEEILALSESVAGPDYRSRSADNPGRYALAKKIETYLRENYRYSLKPGVAGDGDQLHRFLFDVKKGYCSYFAFSMTLMLRSLGVPARVAVGFFVDPASNVLSLYPVRADMAHAWVEVYFPGYGWLEFDPTSDKVADGENLQLGDEIDPEQYSRLIQEILKNRDSLKPENRPTDPVSLTSRALASLGDFVRGTLSRWYFSLPAFLLLLLALRYALRFLPLLFARGPRQRTARAFGLALAGRADSGFRRRRGESAQEYCRALDAFCDSGDAHLRMSLSRDKAMYGPAFTEEDSREFSGVLKSANAAYRSRIGWARTAAAALFLPTVKRRAGKKGLAVFLVAILAASLFGQDGGSGAATESADSMLVRADEAIAAENFDEAASILKSGQAAYPETPNFPRKLGDLYNDKQLYSLAIDEFRRAEKLVPKDSGLIYTMSDALGRLNREEESISYLKRAIELDPGNVDAVSDLGWMYFKVHKTEDGIAVLKKATLDFGFDKGFEMTLGTLYSDRYEYGESKKHYEAAIRASLDSNDRRFAGVAYYNLSILEEKFYGFSEAVKLTEKSIDYYDRASAHLARGELAQKSLDLRRAKAEYETAYAYDTSPLSSVSLADIALDTGDLQKARLTAEENLKRTDHSWMVNFGTDLDSHAMDIYRILMDVYSGLARIEIRRPVSGPLDWIASLAKTAEYSGRAWYCEQRYRRISFNVSKSYRLAGNGIQADINCYNAFEGYPDRARPYLRGAKAQEGSLVPESLPSYELEEAILGKDVRRALAAADRLKQPWEGDMLVDGLSRIGRIMKARGGGKELRALEERLFSLNRGALMQSGLSLPVAILVSSDAKSGERYLASGLKPALKRAGIDFRPAKELASCRYLLSLSVMDGTLVARLEDAHSSRLLALISVPAGGKDGSVRANADKILKAIFTVE
jgi:transglutaminase-like putative cysteine protease/tetratricopeptide (TPR) repeat protein